MRSNTVRFVTSLLAGLVVSCAGIMGVAETAQGQGNSTVVVFPGERTPPPDATAPTMPLTIEFARRHMTLGIEFGPWSFRNEDLAHKMDDEMYMGLRYSRELGLRTAISVMAGYFSAVNVNAYGDDLDFVPIRGQLEFGSYIGNSLSRWYVAAGGGYNFTDEVPSDENQAYWELPEIWIDSEWLMHVVVGFDLRNDSLFATRIEAGYMYYTESAADMYVGSLTIAFQF